MEPRRGADELAVRLKRDAALCLGVLQVIDRGEMAVRQGRVGQRPEMFGRLELRRIRWQEEQVDMLRDAQLQAGMPPGAIQDEHDLLPWAGADLACERLEFDLEEGNRYARRQVKDGAPRGGMDKAHQVAPVVAMLDRRCRARAVETPDFLEDWLQADAVLVDGPELDARLRVRGRDRLDNRTELFLNAACCSGSAKT